MGLTVTTEPGIEPVSRDAAKAHLRVTVDDDDELIDVLIAAARRTLERSTARSFIDTSWTYTLDRFPDSASKPIRLPRSPVDSVTSIKYTDTDAVLQTWSSAEYDVDAASEPGRIVPAYGYTWPSDVRPGTNAVTILFKAGYGTTVASVPADLRVAVKMVLAHLYEHRELAIEQTLHVVPDAVQRIVMLNRVMEAV